VALNFVVMLWIAEETDASDQWKKILHTVAAGMAGVFILLALVYTYTLTWDNDPHGWPQNTLAPFLLLLVHIVSIYVGNCVTACCSHNYELIDMIMIWVDTL